MSDGETKDKAKTSEAEDDEEPGVTMVDVLEDEESLEADAKAVLGNSDEKHCSYHSGGYMKRQALYSCLDCTDASSEGAGICLACSYHCHEGCNLVELYTKRNFRCDCGNSKMDNECKLANDKTPLNYRNQYNQNFKGLYCICSRPYPDPEDSIVDEMIQCIICEDWYHGRHLLKGDQKLPKDENYSEMICSNCCEKYHSVLNPYLGLSVERVSKADDSLNTSVVVEEPSGSGTAISSSGDNPTTSATDETKDILKTCKRKVIVVEEPQKAKTLFMPQNWRKELCKCDECLKLYRDQSLSYLIDDEDTVHHYESQATNEGTQYEKGMEELSKMDRVKQVEAIHGYNSMKSNLMEYLKKFAENGKVVRQEDIQEFFEQMKSNKRPRTAVIPENCR